MSAIGQRNEVINATQTFLILSGDTHILLQDLQFIIDRPEHRDEVEDNALYWYGNHNNMFEATLLLSAPDLGTYIDKTVFSTDALPLITYDIQYTPKATASQTINVQTVSPYLVLDKQATGGVKIRQRFRIVQDVSSADIS